MLVRAALKSGCPNAASGGNHMEGRAAVASANAFLLTATTERGPPDRPTSCAQNAHKFRRKRLVGRSPFLPPLGWVDCADRLYIASASTGFQMVCK